MSQHKGKVVAVTGATGLVGGACVAELVRRGYKVRAAVRDKSDTAKTAHLLAHGEGAVTLVAVPDITGEKGFAALCAGAFGLLHIASPVLSNELSEEEYVKQAVAGTTHALEAAQAMGVERVVVTASMASVCGSQRDKDPDHLWTEEDHNDAPGSSYSLSKTRAEEAAWAFAKKNYLSLTTIHPACVFGTLQPKQQPASTMKMLLAALDGTNKAEGGLPMRAFGVIDIGDVARAHVDALEKDMAENERFLLTSNDQYSIKELVDIACEIEPSLEATAAREWADPKHNEFKAKKPSSSNKRACELLGVDALTDVKKTLADAISSFKELGLLK